MSTLYVMIGLQGSGKSTYARDLSKRTGAIIISSDELRIKENLCGKIVFRRMRELEKEYLKKGYDVILDATNVTIKRRLSYLANEFSENAYKVAIVVNRPIEICLEQNKRRTGKANIPESAIYLTANRFVYPTLSEGFNEIREI